MARAAQSRNLFGFGKRKPARRKKATAKKSRFGFLTESKVTYHRDVKKERAELIREAKAERAERTRSDKAEAARVLEMQRDYAYETGARHKREGQKAQPGSAVTQAATRELGRQKAGAVARSSYLAGYRQNPCASTRKEKVTDRARRYRANQPGCRPGGLKKCKLCGSRSDMMVDHADGNESNGRKSNLRWLCRSCNTLLGAEMARTGEGRRTVQYNPAHKGALTLGEYIQAVLQHTRGAHDAAGKIIHETPKAKRREFASQIWAAREARGTAEHGTSSAGHDEPDWVTNPRKDYKAYSNALLREMLTSPHVPEAEKKAITILLAKRQQNPSALANPDTESEEYSQAKKIAELFHGRPVREEITVTESIREHDWLWRIGPLVSLKIRTLTKRNATLPFHQTEEGMVHLFCSPDGRQFYLRGGDQELDLEALGMGPKSDWYRDHMLIGEAKEITYRDKKKFHRFKLIDYFHKLGEETKKKPALAYDAFAHKMQIIGGQYRVETKDLVDGMSPGIVN